MFILGLFVNLSALTTKTKIEETGISFTVIRLKNIYFCMLFLSDRKVCYLFIGSSSNISESVLMDLMNNYYS